jgi:Caspase domain
MKAKQFYCFLFVLISRFAAHSQSIYHFEYNFHQPEDAIIYHAFFARYDDGNGLLRVRYILPGTTQDVLVEMDTEENFVTDTVTGKTDTSVLLLNATNPRFIIGDSKIKFSPPSFQFAYNAGTGFYEPSGITLSAAKTKMATTTSFVSTLVDRSGLTKEFVAAFFSEDEEFYANLFNKQTKGLTPLEKNIKLYLLVVADTLDESIGSSCSIDMKRAVETFKGLTDFMGIKMITKTISGDDYSKKNVQAAITNLKPMNTDIVVFYYTGHGFRKENTDRFPNIKLKTHHTSRQDVLNNSLSMEEVFTMVQKKGARFNLVLSDCCNSDIEITNITTGTKPGNTKSSGILWDEDNCRNLFLNKTPASILATAADNGQRASSNNDFGGFFSYFFKTSMENYCSKLKSNVNWDAVLQDAKTQTIYKAKHTYCDKPYVPANVCNQYPYYIIR